MSEKTAQSPPTGEEAVALPDSLAAAFQDRIGSLAERMPEHAALLSEAGVRAQSYAGGLGESAAHKVEDVASRFHISAEDSLGKRYSDPAPAAEIERVAGFFRKNHHLNPQGATFQRVRKSVTRFVADDRSKKIEAAKEKIEGLNGSPLVGISDEGKEVFASEVEDEYWQQAGGLLAKLETIAGTDVASARDKGVILSGVAIRRKMGPLHKYMTTNDRHRQFDSALRSIIMTELPRAARDIDDSLTVDRIRQRFPHINPDSSFWQDRIQSVITRLGAELSAREYMPLLQQSVAIIVAQAGQAPPTRRHRRGRPSVQAPHDDIAEPAATKAVGEDIRRLQAEGLTTKAIYRRLAQEYHPDTSGDDERERFNQLSEWYAAQRTNAQADAK